ncbi:hypothetical protein ACE6H2_020756 [Prunus campanulata]
MDQHKTDDNLCYVGGLTRVLAADASISFAGVNCQTKDFKTPTPVVIARRTKMKTISLSPIRPVFPIFNHADYDDTSTARGSVASSSSLRSPLKKLFFEELDTSTSVTLFYNSGSELGS